MIRLISTLIIFFLIAPMVRECCLPVTPTLPCHETKRVEDLSCASNQQATEAKAGIALRPSLVCCDLQAPQDVKAALSAAHEWVADNITTSSPPDHLYLRTGALLI
jgi:hypothetical protein